MSYFHCSMWQKPLLIVLLFSAGTVGCAQFQVGAVVGTFLTPWSISHERYTSAVSSAGAIPVAIALYYRDRVSEKVNFFSEVAYSRRTIELNWSDGGLGYGRTVTAIADVRMVHVGLGPEFTRGAVTVRFGPQFGIMASDHVSGTSYSWTQSTQTSPSRRDTSTTVRLKFKGDLRVLLGARIELGTKARWTCMLDPFASIGVNSMLNDSDLKLRANEVGLRIGLCRSFHGRGFWPTIRAGAPPIH